MPYLDDVGIWATGVGLDEAAREEASFRQILRRLDLVLERLIWAGLTCKMSKCVFFATSGEYLGHIVSRDGLKMDSKKIAAVANIDPRSISTLEAAERKTASQEHTYKEKEEAGHSSGGGKGEAGRCACGKKAACLNRSCACVRAKVPCTLACHGGHPAVNCVRCAPDASLGPRPEKNPESDASASECGSMEGSVYSCMPDEPV